jgi:DNA-binding transcriptional regulator YhcF (GntR family)
MKSAKLMPFQVDNGSAVEKYRQVVDGVVEAIRRGKIRRGDQLPSASVLYQEFGLAKETVIKAYAILRERGVVCTVPRKGYFAATESVEHKTNVMLLFDEFPAYKQTVYDSFMERLGGRAHVDIYFHHCTPALFEKLLLDNIALYDLAVVMPFADPAVGKVLAQVDPRKILILDRREHAGKGFSFIAQEFEESVGNCLESARDLLRKYETFYLVLPLQAEVAIRSSQAPAEIADGFKRFCRRHRLPCKVIGSLDGHAARKGEAFLVIDDTDLVAAVEMARSRGLELGKDMGILSYNESPVKRVIDKGITVISTDFAEQGRRAADYVLTLKPIKEILPTALIRRQSL